jgi:hypothetical protein
VGGAQRWLASPGADDLPARRPGNDRLAAAARDRLLERRQAGRLTGARRSVARPSRPGRRAVANR